MSGKPKFYKRTIKLDTPFTRSQPGSHQISFTYRSLKIISSNVTNPQINFCTDPYDRDADAIALTRGIPQNFKDIVDRGAFENDVAQPGAIVVVQFAVDDEQLGGEFLLDQTGETTLVDGNDFTSVNVLVTNAIVELVPSSLVSRVAYIQNKSETDSIWIGKNTVNELQHADWKKICEELKPGGQWETRNKSAYSAKTESAITVDCSRRNET